MRLWSVLAVSSALLFLSGGSGPHHLDSARVTSAPSVAPGSLLISEFYPAALNQDEYFVVTSISSSEVCLMGCSITDGEGSIRFASSLTLRPAESASVSMNSSAFVAAFGRPPTLDLREAVANGTLSVSGTFRLADAGDSLALVSPEGVLLDCVKYGSCSEALPGWSGDAVPTIRQGEVCRRVREAGVWRDNGCASDWFPFREFRYGYTDFKTLETDVPASGLTAFVSPDCSLEIVLRTIGAAERSVRLCSYEVSSSAVCSALAEACARGVEVQVLVDGAPAGGIDSREIDCLSFLSDSGARVYALTGNLSERRVQHLGFLHAKYMVVDSTTSVVLSENFVESGLPVDKVEGNRGWGVRIGSRDVAVYLAALFDSDSRPTRPDVVPWPDDPKHVPGAALPPAPAPEHDVGALRPFVTSAEAHLTVLPSPDSSATGPFLVELLKRASTMDIEQFQVDLLWEDRWTGKSSVSPLIGAVAEAMRGGASMRMIFDGSWFNVEGNRPSMDFLNALASNASARCECRSLCNGSPISVVHNKGALIDASAALVSSNNWGHASFARNRELAVIIGSSEVSAYFRRAFEMDWEPDTVAPVAEAGEDIETLTGRMVLLDGSGSHDDRVIANYSWDVDGDGRPELYGPDATFVPARDGSYRVTLTVRDVWGNEGVDSMLLRVTARSADSWAPPALGSSAFALGASGGALGALWARARARKVNHPPPPDH